MYFFIMRNEQLNIFQQLVLEILNININFKINSPSTYLAPGPKRQVIIRYRTSIYHLKYAIQ